MFSSTKSAVLGVPEGGFILANYNSVTGALPLTQNIVVPEYVTNITALAVGGGGGGGGSPSSVTSSAGGGGGGAVSYGPIPVTPGETLTITVGVAGAGTPTGTGDPGGNTTIQRGATVLLRAVGGEAGKSQVSPAAKGGNASLGVGLFRYSGGDGGPGAASDEGGGGGGAAGYSGNGGIGGSASPVIFLSNGTSGSGGAGGGGTYGRSPTGTDAIGGQGGNVMIYGEGASGANGAVGSLKGKIGSSLGGTVEDSYNYTQVGSTFGGGGGGDLFPGSAGGGSDGYPGAVRILWGSGRAFPSTNVDNGNIQVIATASSNTSTIVVPSVDIHLGDCLVLVDYASSANATPSEVYPTNFVKIGNSQTARNTRVSVSSFTSINNAIQGTTLTGMNPSALLSPVTEKTLYVLRAKSGMRFVSRNFEQVVGNTYINNTSPPVTTTFTYSLTSYDAYYRGIPMVFALFRGATAINPATDIGFAGGTLFQGTSNLSYNGYKFYSQTANISVTDSLTMANKSVNTLYTFCAGGY